MATVTDIVVYPLKSAAGVTLGEADVADSGLAYDREWMVVDGEANCLTQREYSKLAVVQPVLTGGQLSLRAPGMQVLDLPSGTGEPLACSLFGETCRAFATSPAANAWISDYLGAKAAIVTRDRSFLRKGGVQYPQRDDRPTSFVDNYGVLIISRASLSDLNSRLEEPVPMNRFRPNIVVDGLPAYEEEEAKGFASEEIEFAFTNVCTRCVIPNIDQATAAIKREPFQTLSSFRFDEGYRGVRFGAYAAVAAGIGCKLRVGDALVLQT